MITTNYSCERMIKNDITSNHRHNVAQVLPVEIDLVDVRFQREIKRESVIINDSIFDVIQLTWDTCSSGISVRLTSA